LRQVLQRRFVQPLAFQRHQAHRLRGSIHSQHHWRQRTRRQTAQVGHGKIRNVAQGRIGIGTRLEVNLDQAHAGKRAGFAVVDVRGQREETLERVGDVGFDLLGRHAVVKRSHHNHRHIDLGKQVDRHTHDIHYADKRYHQAQHQDEVGESEGKLRH